MIVTNRDKVITQMKIFQGLLILSCNLAVAAYILTPNIYEYLRWPGITFFIVIGLVCIVKITRLKVFHFENSGVIFTIKYYHPSKKGLIFPAVEYPVDKMRTLKIERSLFSDFIIMDVYLKEKEKLFRIKMRVNGISDSNYRKIANSFS